jgi:hypothetical protein
MVTLRSLVEVRARACTAGYCPVPVPTFAAPHRLRHSPIIVRVPLSHYVLIASVNTLI